ncbi:MAG: TlpA disulfide reductase family protein [Acidimicrobiales bacterium]
MSNSVKTARRTVVPAAPVKRPKAIWFVIGGVFVVALVVSLLVATKGSNDGNSGLAEFQPVTVTGTPLPKLGDSDTAVGRPIPQVKGASFDGTPVEIANDGRAKLIFFVAHWCPHCRAEVPVVTAWLESGGAPKDVDLYAVSTAVSSDQPNYPPSAWLQREKWPIATMADNEAASAASAFGLSAFPFFAAVKADGTVALRTSGELTVAQLSALAQLARG